MEHRTHSIAGTRIEPEEWIPLLEYVTGVENSRGLSNKGFWVTAIGNRY
jgi:hypothetical protein